MAASDEIRNDQAERDGLQKAISEVETQLSVSTPGTRAVFEQFLQNAKGRVATLETKIHEAEREKEQHAESEAALVALAEKETALNEKEKEQYSGFLKEDFFTKKDFARLDEFYAHAWDRLSERGKDEISHRIWEGVRREEYKFTDLPRTVQEKETERAYAVLKQREVGATGVAGISEADRRDFVNAYGSGNKELAARILDRKCFGENMGAAIPSVSRRAVEADKGRDPESKQIAEATKASASPSENQKPETSQNPLGHKDFSSLDLSEIKPPDDKLAMSPTELPSQMAMKTVQR